MCSARAYLILTLLYIFFPTCEQILFLNLIPINVPHSYLRLSDIINTWELRGT